MKPKEDKESDEKSDPRALQRRDAQCAGRTVWLLPVTRSKLDDIRGTPMDVGSLEEFIDEPRAERR